MARSDMPDRKRPAIQQLLFGYDRGHRLLAASSASAKTLAPAILPVTDWDPRTAIGTDSYLSGRPISGEKTYALMRTWKAPEMPRPGCVWTHALLIAAIDLARIGDLTALDPLLQRPRKPGDYGTYLDTIDFDLSNAEDGSPGLDIWTASSLVRLTYGDVQAAPPTDDIALDRGILALWSQQWPGLRRQFSFRTAPLTPKNTSLASEFDVELYAPRPPSENDKESWKEVAYDLIAEDLIRTSSGPFRRFLWRYGADTDNRRRSLVRLTHIYQSMRSRALANGDISSIIARIAKWYPQPHDAHLLKMDISRTKKAEFSLVPDLDTLEVSNALVATQAQNAFPPLEAVNPKTIKSWLRKRPSDLIKLLGASAEKENCFAESLFAGISSVDHPDFLWKLHAESSAAFLRASKGTLGHLVDPRIDRLDDKTLLILLTATEEESPIFAELVPFLLRRSDTDLISLIANRARDVVTGSVIDSLARYGNTALDANWVECIKEHPDRIKAFAKSTAERRSQILVCRYLLDADFNACDLTVWSKRLNKIPNDLSGQIDLEFRVFLLIQALQRPAKGVAPLLADALEPVYYALAERTLPFRTEMHLANYLPSIGWIANWDKCLRLKIAIVATCKHLGMSKKATLALTENERLRVGLSRLW